MSLNDCLQHILKDKVLENVPPGDNSVELKEPKQMSVRITGIPSSLTAIRMRKINHLPCLKDGQLKRSCDYLLIAQMNGDYHAIFIELKKTLTEEEKPKDQLRRSLPLLDYLLSVCKIECGNKPKLSIKYALIAEKGNERLDKQGTRVQPSEPVSIERDKTINVMTFITPRISITELVRG